MYLFTGVELAVFVDVFISYSRVDPRHVVHSTVTDVLEKKERHWALHHKQQNSTKKTVKNHFSKIAILFLCDCCTETTGITFVTCSARISVDKLTDRPSTVTLAAHAHGGLKTTSSIDE